MPTKVWIWFISQYKTGYFNWIDGVLGFYLRRYNNIMQVHEKHALGSVVSSSKWLFNVHNTLFSEVKSILGELGFHRHVRYTPSQKLDFIHH